jgi:hypothetical protein
VLVFPAACSAADGGEDESDSNEDAEASEASEASDDRLPDETCELLDRFEELEEAVAPPEVIELDEAARCPTCWRSAGTC